MINDLLWKSQVKRSLAQTSSPTAGMKDYFSLDSFTFYVYLFFLMCRAQNAGLSLVDFNTEKHY